MPASEQGIDRDRYLLIPRVLVFVRRGTSILLLKGAPTKRLWPNRYNGIGGHIEPGEDILSAARRELLEEAGLTEDSEITCSTSAIPGQGLWLCGTIMVDTGKNPGIGIFVFTGECSQGEPQPSDEGTLHWVDYDELSSLPIVEDLPVLVNRIQGMKRGDPPFAARSFYDAEGKQVIIFEGK